MKFAGLMIAIGLIVVAGATVVFARGRHKSASVNPPAPPITAKLFNTSEQDAQDEARLGALPVRPIEPGEIRVPILLYHRIENSPDGKQHSYVVGPQMLEKQLQWLHDNGYHVISLKQLTDFLRSGNNRPPENSVVLTFDDGTASEFTSALPVLQKFHYPATFFIPTKKIDIGSANPASGYMNWQQVKQLAEAGMDIEGHSLSHPTLTRLKPAQLTAEVAESKKILEQQIGKAVTLFAYPGGSFNQAVIDQIKKAGYAGAVATLKDIDHSQRELYQLGRLHIDDDMPYFKARVQGRWFE